MVKLCSELPFHSDRLGQSSLPHALCDGGKLTPIVVQLRASVFNVAAPLSTAWMAISKLAPEPVAFYAAVFFLVNATYICLIRELVERTHDVTAQVRRIYVNSFDHDFMPLRPRRGDRAEIPFRRTRNLYLLSGCLSQARSAWSGKEKISLGLEVDNWPSLKRAKAKDAARSRSHPPDPRVRSRQNRAASSPTRPRAG